MHALKAMNYQFAHTVIDIALNYKYKQNNECHPLAIITIKLHRIPIHSQL